MRGAPNAALLEYVTAVAVARIVLGARMRIQVPPNLSDPDELALLVGADVDDHRVLVGQERVELLRGHAVEVGAGPVEQLLDGHATQDDRDGAAVGRGRVGCCRMVP